jgi:hypothetical protein
MKKRFFQVGYNRCGTTAIADMFERNGFITVHHSYLSDGEVRNVAIDLEANLSAGCPPLKGMDHIDVFTDIEYVAADRIIEGYRYFREISESYPEMHFILNLRKRDDWIRSRLNFGDYPDRYAAYLGIDRDAVEAQWEQDWDNHIHAVMQEIPSEKLLVWNIDETCSKDVDAFLGPKASELFRARNKSARGPFARLARHNLPEDLIRITPNWLKNFLKNF